MKAAFLIRCSTQVQDYQRQISDLRRICKRNNFTTDESLIYGEYITGKDDCVQGDRNSIILIKRDAELRLFDIILVSEVSRLSRDVISGGTYVRQLTQLNIPIYFKDLDIWTIDPVTGIPTRNAEDLILNSLMAASKYIKSMKIQIASARRMNYELYNQLSTGTARFGYKKRGGVDKTTKNQWVIDNCAAEIVKDIFTTYVSGKSFRETAILLSAKHGKHITFDLVRNTLRYKPYTTGILKAKCTDPDTGDVDYYNISIPQIISVELFNHALNVRKSYNTGMRKNKPSLLSGKLICGSCNHKMIYAQYHGRRYWRCYSKSRNRCTCNSGITISHNIEELIRAFLSLDFVKDEQLYHSIGKTRSESLKMANKGILEALEDKILKLEAKKKKAYLLAIESDSIDLYHGVLNKINHELSSVRKAITELKEHVATESKTTPDDILIKVIPTKIKKGEYAISVYLRNNMIYQILYNQRLYQQRMLYYKLLNDSEYTCVEYIPNLPI
jgi:DNA invertase Pin-like site-specific DNA recombinase